MLNTASFIEKASRAHQNFYDYRYVKYHKSREKVIILCSLHGSFEQVAAQHLNGAGCRECGIQKVADGCRSNSKEFIDKAVLVHGDKYDYSEVKYKSLKHKVQIICRIHGVFSQLPDNHLSGQGCSCCSKAGFKRDTHGYLYILSFEDITKVGITNYPVDRRLKKINKSSGKNFEITSFIKFSDGAIADDVETKLLQYLRNKYSPVTEKFDGFGECFFDVKYEELLKKTSELIYETLKP